MPTYDYVCEACGQTFEIFHSMSEPARTVCPACGKSALKRKIGEGCGILFKGSGFYETDYKQHASCGSCSDHKSGACSGCDKASSTTACPQKTSVAPSSSDV
ncbi:MAG: zinc ribbon domain-containing protein [Opitutales bacterium]|nr:zinc ribbon domain-containing protein [Opitutales bacterium]